MSDSIFTITAPATERKLCTLAALKQELSVTGSAQDAALEARIVEASRVIESYCRRVFARETVREVFRRTHIDELNLRRYPVTTVTSLEIDGTTMAGTDYELDAEAGQLWRLRDDCRIQWCAGKVTAVYSSGYVLPGLPNPDLPEDISRACVLLAAATELSEGRDPMLRSDSAQDVGQTSWLDPRAGMEALPPQVAGLLEPYRSFA